MTPFPDDDPMLATRDRFGDCDRCGQAHRLDLGCYVELTESQDDSANVVVWCVAGVMVCLVGAMVMQLVAG